MPLDVVFIHPSRTPRGGIVNAALAHALALSSRGHRVELWTASEDVARRSAALDLRVFHSPSLAGSLGAFGSPRLMSALWRVRQRRVDAVVHHGARLHLPGLFMAPARRQFVIFHNEKLGGRRRFKNWLVLSQRHTIQLDQIARRHDLRRFIATVPNALLNAPAASAPSSRMQLGAPLRIGALAELKAHKGIDLLLRAAHRLIAQGVDAELHIGGAGPEREKLVTLGALLGISERIIWHGWVDAPDAFFANFDVFCAPATREPFGLAVIEAMARGKIVIASRTEGPSDIIVDQGTGYLIPIGDEEALTVSLRAVAAAPDQALRIAEAGRRHVLQAYSLSAVGKEFEDVISRAELYWRT